MQRRWIVGLFLVMVAYSSFLIGCGGGGSSSSAAPTAQPIPPVANACQRPAAGSLVTNPPDLFSRDGLLKVNFSYQTTTDADGRTLFCFMTPEGLENPTLHVHPGDHLIINLTNNTPVTPVALKIDPPNCGATVLTGSSVNMHFHGTNTSPNCQQDEVIRTMVNSGQAFHYDVHFPKDEPPGLYWYHPHAHMLVESALQGGGSGAIVVEGLQNFQPGIAGLPEQIMVIRDQNVAGNPEPGGNVPSWDLTINNIPIAYPAEIPAVIQMQSGQSQLWSVSNSSADSILDLQVRYDGVPQTVQIVAFDGVPANSQDGTAEGQPVAATDVLIPTAGRAQFIVTPPTQNIAAANLMTLAINTGPDGDNDPQRTLANIELAAPASTAPISAAYNPEGTGTVPEHTGAKWPERFAGLAAVAPVKTRTLYFSEDNPNSQFFITITGAIPVLFDPNNPPAIVTTQGSVEEWTIQNQSLENHEFHIHQLHFLVESQDNFEMNGSQQDPNINGQVMDTIQLPFWDGDSDHPYPSVTLKLDFRGPDTGDFVYHCHIAEHEDDGMMAIIRVKSSTTSAAIERARLYLASLGRALGRLSELKIVAETPKTYAWCSTRRPQLKRTAQIKNGTNNQLPLPMRSFKAPALE